MERRVGQADVRWEERAVEGGAKERVDQIRELVFLATLPNTLEFLQQRVSNLTETISYVGPARATSERYYRIRELAVDQIDPRGENLAMYLNSLPEHEQNQFSEWVEKSVGHAVKVKRHEGHVQLHLRERRSDAFHNLADTGYGFSQILPVLAQIWSRNSRSRRAGVRNLSLVAIEQPELHLHPAYQAKLADIFVNSVVATSGGGKSSNRQTRYIVETHQPHRR